MPDNASLTAKQQHAISLLIEGKTGLYVAETCGINEATLYRWKKTQVWKDAYAEAKKEVGDQALEKLVRYVSAAIDTLARNMVNDTGAVAAIRGVQVRAAQAILDAFLQVHHDGEWNKRLEALEAIARPTNE